VPSRHTTATPSPPGWMVVGSLTRVHQGSRALRGVIGFGLGATKLETIVHVYDLSDLSKPFLTFETTGGSNAEPGAVTGIGPVTAATGIGLVAGGAGNVMHGLSEDAWRTSRMICAHLADYFASRGWKTDKQIADEAKAKASTSPSSSRRTASK